MIVVFERRDGNKLCSLYPALFNFKTINLKEMKYTKLLSKIFDNRSNNNGQVAVALVAGLAAGAILSILFAPDSGANVRRGIADQARGLGNGIRDGYGRLRDRVVGQQELDEPIATEMPHYTHKVTKRPKSDIKDIVHEAHAQHTEQSLG